MSADTAVIMAAVLIAWAGAGTALWALWKISAVLRRFMGGPAEQQAAVDMAIAQERAGQGRGR